MPPIFSDVPGLALLLHSLLLDEQTGENLLLLPGKPAGCTDDDLDVHVAVAAGPEALDALALDL